MTTDLPASAAVTAAARAAPPEPMTTTSASSVMGSAAFTEASPFMMARKSAPAASAHSATAVAKAMEVRVAPVTVSTESFWVSR